MAHRSTPSKSNLRFNPIATPPPGHARQQTHSVAQLEASILHFQSLLDDAKKREAAAASLATAQALHSQQLQSEAPKDISRFPASVQSQLNTIATRIKDISTQISDIVATHKSLQNNWTKFDDAFKIEAKSTADKMSATHRVLVAALKDLKVKQLQIIEDAEAKISALESPKKGVFARPVSPGNTHLRVMSFLSTGTYTPPPPKIPLELPPLATVASLGPSIKNDDAQLVADELDVLQASMRPLYPSLPPLRLMEQAAPPKPLAPSMSIKREPVPHLHPGTDWDADAWSNSAPLHHQETLLTMEFHEASWSNVKLGQVESSPSSPSSTMKLFR